MINADIYNLSKIRDHELLEKMLERINKGEKIQLSIVPVTKTQLCWDGVSILDFDAHRPSNPHYNGISVIRELMKEKYPEKNWTRRKIKDLVDFGLEEGFQSKGYGISVLFFLFGKRR